MPYWLILYPSLMRYEVLPGTERGWQITLDLLPNLSQTYLWHINVGEENGKMVQVPRTYRPPSRQTCKRMIRTLAEGQGYTRLPGSRELP